MPSNRKAIKKLGSRSRAKASPRSPHISLTRRDKQAGQWFAKLVALQARLRGPNGCPWDHEQTHQSLRKFLIEETYEVLDAMDSADDPRKFASELGDLLLQVVFHSVLAEETGAFTISDVIESIHTKMVRRHPHVFGDAEAKDSAAVLKNWEQIKSEERAEANGKGSKGEAARDTTTTAESILAGVPRSLPGVLEAYQLTRRAAHIGFDWENLAGIFDKLEEEKREIVASLKAATPEDFVGARHVKGPRGPTVPASASPALLPATPRQVPASPHLEEEVGDLLFAAVNVARFLGADPEIALKKANRKFQTRFRWMESTAAAEGHRLADVPRARMEELWDLSKSQEAARKAANAK
ncbi:MAG: nucleoside triphosphate pyrophosphohydrolase [Candidatus Acidiferrales bacterium]